MRFDVKLMTSKQKINKCLNQSILQDFINIWKKFENFARKNSSTAKPFLNLNFIFFN